MAHYYERGKAPIPRCVGMCAYVWGKCVRGMRFSFLLRLTKHVNCVRNGCVSEWCLKFHSIYIFSSFATQSPNWRNAHNGTSTPHIQHVNLCASRCKLHSMLNADCSTCTEIDVHVLSLFISWTQRVQRVVHLSFLFCFVEHTHTCIHSGRDCARAYICYMNM